MSNINVNLTPYLKTFVEGKVRGGRYNNASEVVREALRLLEQRDAEHAARLRDLRAAIDEGEASGEPTPLDIEGIIARTAARHATASKMRG